MQSKRRIAVLPRLARTAAIASLMIGFAPFATVTANGQTCPLSYGTTDDAKSHKLFLYFPTANDNSFPNYDSNVSPAKKFDVNDLNPAIGTTAQLEDRIHQVVVDDYCEFNVQVLATTTNPANLTPPPARRVTVAVGTDNNGGTWGEAKEVDIGDTIDVDFARVWAGTYTTCEGATPTGGCTHTGSLTGSNATLDRWGQAIGGTAAHEGGHTYGLAHTDEDPPDNLCLQPGPPPVPGEDSYHRHTMPTGCYLSGDDRATYRRHFGNRTYGILANNVGLSIQTMHNWDLTNPNAGSGYSLTIEFLSSLSSVTSDWSYAGGSSPWINPVVSGPLGTRVWKGTTYNVFHITWSTPNPGWGGGTPGVVTGGSQFHIGATFTGVDFNQPDPILIQDVTLFDNSSNPLTLHPRLPIYDAGTVDGTNQNFGIHFFPPILGGPLQMQNATIFELPRVASIDSMVGRGSPMTFDGAPIVPWAGIQCGDTLLADGREGSTCNIGRLSDRPHVEVIHRLGEEGVVDCHNGVPPSVFVSQGSTDRSQPFDDEGPVCAGVQRDPFPSTTVYVVATFIDPQATYWDPQQQRYVVGPLSSKVFYQFAGRRVPPNSVN